MIRLDVYTCGANENGQLGLGDTEPRSSPKRVRWKEDLTDAIVSVALSPSHSVALTSKGQISITLITHQLVVLTNERMDMGAQ